MSPAERALRELKREKAMRERLYPGWVESGRMTAAEAKNRIADLVEAILIVQEAAEREMLL